MYQLIIAEKPSVAQSIAAVLGAKRRETGYLEGGGYLVSWCFGHLAELHTFRECCVMASPCLERREKWQKPIRRI